jgi:hypothetical protein
MYVLCNFNLHTPNPLDLLNCADRRKAPSILRPHLCYYIPSLLISSSRLHGVRPAEQQHPFKVRTARRSYHRRVVPSCSVYCYCCASSLPGVGCDFQYVPTFLTSPLLRFSSISTLPQLLLQDEVETKLTHPVLAGFGNGLADAAWNAWIGNMANPNEVLGFLHAFYGLGAVLAPLIATTMITKGERLPWYYFYYVMVRSLQSFALLLMLPIHERVVNDQQLILKSDSHGLHRTGHVDHRVLGRHQRRVSC